MYARPVKQQASTSGWELFGAVSFPLRHFGDNRDGEDGRDLFYSRLATFAYCKLRLVLVLSLLAPWCLRCSAHKQHNIDFVRAPNRKSVSRSYISDQRSARIRLQCNLITARVLFFTSTHVPLFLSVASNRGSIACYVQYTDREIIY